METLLISRPHHVESSTSWLAIWKKTLKEVQVRLNTLVILLHQDRAGNRRIVFCYVHRNIVAMVMLMLLSLRRHWILIALGIVLLTDLLLLSGENTLVPLPDRSLI